MTIAATKTVIRAVVPKTTAMTIRRFASVTGKSQSAVIAEFLTEAEPSIRRLAGMLEVAKNQGSLFPRTTVAELEAALDDLSGSTTDVMDRVQKAMQLPLEHGPGGKGGARTAGRQRRPGARTPRRKRSGTPG